MIMKLNIKFLFHVSSVDLNKFSQKVLNRKLSSVWERERERETERERKDGVWVEKPKNINNGTWHWKYTYVQFT
jgi:hypothetical protein